MIAAVAAYTDEDGDARESGEDYAEYDNDFLPG
jgi:hypothetical protein